MVYALHVQCDRIKPPIFDTSLQRKLLLIVIHLKNVSTSKLYDLRFICKTFKMVFKIAAKTVELLFIWGKSLIQLGIEMKVLRLKISQSTQ